MTDPSPPSTVHRLRAAAALTIAAALAARALFILCTSAYDARTAPHSRDLVVHGQARLACFRPVIAPQATVGYLDEDAANRAWFIVAQYTLAPVALRRSIDHRLIVANFRNEEQLRAALVPGHLEVVERFGDGRALLENLDAPR